MGDFVMLLVSRQRLVPLLAKSTLIYFSRRDNVHTVHFRRFQIVIDLCFIHHTIFQFGNCKNAECIVKCFRVSYLQNYSPSSLGSFLNTMSALICPHSGSLGSIAANEDAVDDFVDGCARRDRLRRCSYFSATLNSLFTITHLLLNSYIIISFLMQTRHISLG